MKKLQQYIILFIITLLIITQFTAYAYADTGSDGQLAITKLQELGVTNGIGNNQFGTGSAITRGEFIAYLCNLMKWEKITPTVPTITDNTNTGAFYYSPIETAAVRSVITKETPFRPNDSITREEIAIMLINSLGYNQLAVKLDTLASPFSDVTANKGTITMAKDLGIISGISENTFMPNATASREQAAVMLVRMHTIMQNQVGSKNGFYAIKSASQASAIAGLNTVCFGWSRIETDGTSVSLNTSASNNNEYNVPAGWDSPYSAANGKAKLLMVAVKDEHSAVIINNPTLRKQAADSIAKAINTGLTDSKIMFDGVLLDFETLKGSESRNNYNEFLTQIRQAMGTNGKLMYVAVHPKRQAPHEYYDGYDYKTIGALADKVIIMAHDYNAKKLTTEEMAAGIVMTPVAPIDEVYYALKAATDTNTGIQDTGKIMIQYSFGTAQWKTQNGVVMNEKPYTPEYDAIVSRIQSGAEMKYSKVQESPYITFRNEADNTNNVVWYEDSRSIDAKIQLQLLFGVKDISLWRLGIVPNYDSSIYLDVLQKTLAR